MAVHHSQLRLMSASGEQSDTWDSGGDGHQEMIEGNETRPSDGTDGNKNQKQKGKAGPEPALALAKQIVVQEWGNQRLIVWRYGLRELTGYLLPTLADSLQT